MDKGNWIPISKVFVKHLPKGREYSQVEAAFSLQVDYDCENKVTVSGYAALWRWSRNKVTRFMDEMNVKIIYPENIRRKQNQKGQIAIQNKGRNRTDKGQIRVIENKDLKVSGHRSGTDKGQMKDRSRNTTKEPINLNPEPKPKKKTTGKFIKPNFQDVSEYCLFRKNNVDPNTFIDFYESKGWMVGKNKMKDWKAAVRTWEKSNKNSGTGKRQNNFDDLVDESFNEMRIKHGY